jgi:hypothetical protein
VSGLNVLLLILEFWFVIRDAGGVTRFSQYLVYENRYGCACVCCKFGVCGVANAVRWDSGARSDAA